MNDVLFKDSGGFREGAQGTPFGGIFAKDLQMYNMEVTEMSVQKPF